MSASRSPAPFAFAGRLTDLTEANKNRLLNRGQATVAEVERGTAEVIESVRANGDAALIELARRFDQAVPSSLEVPPEECRTALADLEPELRAALEYAADNVRKFHAALLPADLSLQVQPGVTLSRLSEPLASVGVYVPGGRASYPSSVLMGVIPARVAGVSQVIVCTPPAANGKPPAAVLAACALAGADRVFAVGGAGAVAAMALGTRTVPRVNKIVGPGNAFVAEAKRQLTGVVASDSPAGPSEVLIVADASADPELVALELIAQAEHDPAAASVLVAVGEAPARAVEVALKRLLPQQQRQEVVRASLAAAGALLTAETLDEALAFANLYAPEHLALMLKQPRSAVAKVRNAGSVFVGSFSSVVFGDYVTGANHTLPTGGLARAYSGLSTLDFLRTFTVQKVSAEAAANLAPVAADLAAAEGLYAHAAAARARIGNDAGRQPVAGDDGDGGDGGDGATGQRAPGALRRFRLAYRGIELYDPRRTPVEVDLSDNTNLFEPHPAALRALRELRNEQIGRYPSVYATELRSTLAALHGVQPENVTTGSGLDGVIDAAVRAFCDPGATIAFPDPTFGMVSLFGRMNGVQPLPVLLKDDLSVDVDGLLASRSAVTYVCNPNNPTGKPVSRAVMQRLNADARGVVLIDEAYADFAGPEAASGQIDLAGNTLILRTLSKAYGLAGLRVGYAMGPADLVREIEKSRGPYKVTASAEAAALAVLRGDTEWLDEVVQRTVSNRQRLLTELTQRGFQPLPSAANFVLVPMRAQSLAVTPPELPAGAPGAAPGRERATAPATDPATSLGTALRKRGVAVRAFPDLARIGPAIRVSIGPWPMLQRFLEELDALPELTAGATTAGRPRTTATDGTDRA